MGINFMDGYSLLHAATGVISYYWGLTILLVTILSIIFEYLENTTYGMSFIRNIKLWPGGKSFADSNINQLGDTIFVAIGWYIAKLVMSP